MADQGRVRLLFFLLLAGCAGTARYPFLAGPAPGVDIRFDFTALMRTRPGGSRTLRGTGRIFLLKVESGADSVRIRPVLRTAALHRPLNNRDIRVLIGRFFPEVVTGLDGGILGLEEGGALSPPDPATVFLYGCLLPALNTPPDIPASLDLSRALGGPVVGMKGTYSESLDGQSLVMTRTITVQPFSHGRIRLRTLSLTIRQRVEHPGYGRAISRIRFFGTFTYDALIPVNGSVSGSIRLAARSADGS